MVYFLCKQFLFPVHYNGCKFIFLLGVIIMRFHEYNNSDYSFTANKSVRRVGNGIAKVPVVFSLK